ncbi:putative secreted protein [Xanthomonas translucens pv. poae]|uniref:Putative secreted protein n=1 Tax=Xanthomonas graminis pv. poae TaxID=227946 RepID=A0A0K3A2V0_9XANT|nr:RAQPRD family integrative conjugative element protein [Xanthomonas translucens]CTP91607.1 putative secreted protein [Xanthomonas translucens pv. poae]
MTSRATASHAASPRLPLSGVLAVALLCSAASAQADAALERERLAGAQRLLDQADRLAATAAPAAASEPSRYHFDYARLHDDVRRLQAGVASYLVPGQIQGQRKYAFQTDISSGPVICTPRKTKGPCSRKRSLHTR